MSDIRPIVPAPSSEVVDIGTTIQTFEGALLGKALEMGLPSTDVLVDIDQRVVVLKNMNAAMALLPLDKRATSLYLSKFMFAVSAGLFDAALNYLWDETIGELRKRIVNYDLNYFFDLAATSPEKRKELSGPDDLLKITDDELIKSAARMEFISPVGQQQLDLVRFMRNHASAAHPNQHELQPLSLLSYMETCIREVIMLPQSPTMVQTSRLLANVKTTVVTPDDAASFTPLFVGLRREQTETLANGLFGIYVAVDSTPVMRDNIRLLLPHIWPNLAEDVKFTFGVRFARFKANLDNAQAEFAREFLGSVGGSSYLPEDVRAGDIDLLVDRLHSAHSGWDNFYHEPPVAKALQEYIGNLPLPAGVRGKYAYALIGSYLGRAAGVSVAAIPIYEDLIQRMTPAEANWLLFHLSGPDFSGLLSSSKPQLQLRRLLSLIAQKFVSLQAKALFSNVLAFTGPLGSLSMDSRTKELRAALEAAL